MVAPSNRKRVLRHACEPLERRRLLAAVSWDGGGDGANWNDPLNWSNNQLPTPADDVTLAVGSLVQLLDNQGNPEIKSLTTSVPLQLSVQTLTVDGDVTLGANVMMQKSSLIVDGNLTLNNHATLFLNQGYSNPASTLAFLGDTDRTISGNGTVDSGADDCTSYINNSTLDPSTNTPMDLTLESGISLVGGDFQMSGTNSGGTITNDGTITAGFFTIGNADSTFINNGSITITDNYSTIYNLQNGVGASVLDSTGALYLEGDWHNDGLISVDNASLLLDGSFKLSDLETPGGGTFSRSTVDPNFVYLGGTLDNINSTLTLDDTLGDWFLAGGGTVLGGTINTTAAHTLIGASGTLDGVTLDGSMTVDEGNTVYIEDSLTLNSTITLGNDTDGSSGQLYFTGPNSESINGIGQIAVQGEGTGYITNATSAPEANTPLVLTFGNGITITGKRMTMQGGPMVNQGVITAAGDGGGWELGDSSSFENSGSISASDGVQMQINDLLNDAGSTVSASSNAILTLIGDDWQNLGTLSLDGATLNLGGSFVFADLGTFDRSSADPGTVNLYGILDNTGLTLTFNDTIGDWNLIDGGDIIGGIVDATPGHQLFGLGGELDGTTLNAPISIAENSTVYVIDGLTLNSSMTLGSAADDTYGQLYFENSTPQLLDGSGQIIAQGNGASYLTNEINDPDINHDVVTIGSGITISGNNLVVQGVGFVNHGQLNANVPGGNWALSNIYSFENAGSISVSSNVTFQINNLTNDAASLTTTGDISIGPDSCLVATGSFTNSGKIDLNGAMILNYTDTSPIDSIRSQLLTGFAAGAWNGDGIDSSFAATHRTMAIGFAEASDLNVTTFAGQDVGPDSLLLLCTRAGDANLDGLVNIADFNQLAAHFNSTSQRWSDADFNYDGKINLLDLNAVATNFGQPPAPAQPAGAILPPAESPAPTLFSKTPISADARFLNDLDNL
jgi:Dockerin type I domain